MNIVLISPEFPPLTNWGGVATFVQNLAELLVKQNHTVHVLTFDGRGEEEKSVLKNGMTIHYVRYKTKNKLFNVLYYRFPFGFIRLFLSRYFPSLLFIVDWNVFSFLLFLKLNKSKKFDVIHVPTYFAPGLIVRIFFGSTPQIFHVQGPQEFINKYEVVNRDRAIKAWIENVYTNWGASAVVTCSKNLEKDINIR